MIRFLHAADFHLDSAFSALPPRQAASRRRESRELLARLAEYVNGQGIQLVLLPGDLLDSTQPFRETIELLAETLGRMHAKVFIAPGNHDPYLPGSLWQTVEWPENVHVFKQNALQTVELPDLNAVIYGAAFVGREQSSSLLAGFSAPRDGRLHIGVLHGEVEGAEDRYNSMRREEIAVSGLDYLALGHIHKRTEPLRCGRTLCAWPGCPMGRGFDELDAKGVLIVTLEASCTANFLPLDTPRFHLLEAEIQTDAAATLAAHLPAAGNTDFYRITLTGESDPVDTDMLAAQFSHFPNLELRDRTVPPIDLWASAGDDTLEGVYFRLLQEALEDGDDAVRRQVCLAAKISRQLLNGQEVKLP